MKFIIELKNGTEYVSDVIRCFDFEAAAEAVEETLYTPESAIDILLAEYVELTTKVGGMKVAFSGDQIRVVTGPVE